MIRFGLIFLSFGLIAQSLCAGPKQWANRHKMTIAAAVALTVTESLEAKSTWYAERVCPTCADNGFFGPHPTHLQVWGASAIIVSSMTTLNLLVDKYHPDKGGDIFAHVLFTVPLAINGIVDTRDNYGAPIEVQQARKRLLAH